MQAGVGYATGEAQGVTKALRIHEIGGPEVFVWEEVELDPPGPGEARLRHTAIGVNYVDTYHRSGGSSLEGGAS